MVEYITKEQFDLLASQWEEALNILKNDNVELKANFELLLQQIEALLK